MTQTIKQRVTLAHCARELRAIKEILDAPSATFSADFRANKLPTTNSSPPALPAQRTTSGAALGAARSFFRSARHSVTVASSFFRRRVSSFFTLRNKEGMR
jgi:hypothetical protein